MQFHSVIAYDADPASAPIEIPDESPTPAFIRTAHASIEASIKALGVLCLLGAMWGGLRLLGSFADIDTNPAALQGILFAAAWFVAAARCTTWLWALDRRGRLLYTALFLVDAAVFAYQAYQAHALLTMLRETFAMTAASHVSFHHDFYSQLATGFALLLVRCAFLYALWSRKGRMVMSRHYRDTIIPATPGLEHRGRVPLLVVLTLLLIGALMLTASILTM